MPDESGQPRAAHETLWQAIVLTEHAWALVDEERFGVLGKEEGWAILDELGFGFTAMREALGLLRPSIARLPETELDRMVDAAIERSFKPRRPAGDIRGYLIEMVRQAQALLQGLLITIELADVTSVGPSTRELVVDQIEEGSERLATALYGLDPRQFAARMAKEHDPDNTLDLLDEAVHHESALEHGRRELRVIEKRARAARGPDGRTRGASRSGGKRPPNDPARQP